MEKVEPKISKPAIYKKNWGKEIWIHNSESYCGKILEIDKGHKMSMHFHKLKKESWYVLCGNLLFDYYDLKTATRIQTTLPPGSVVDIEPCLLHSLYAVEDSKIVEVSTQHFEDDSYRIEKSV